MKSPTILVSAISIESRWKIIGEAPNYACAGESAIGGWGVGTIRKDKVCIDHRRRPDPDPNSEDTKRRLMVH